MPFLAKLDLDARRSRRMIASGLDGLLIGRDRRFDVIIHNMSESGFLAEFASDLAVGDEVTLNVARLGFVPARVAWKRGQGHGCAFVAPIPLEIVEETIATGADLGGSGGPGVESERAALVAERRGIRHRLRRERFGRLMVMVCWASALAVLAAALIRILAG